MGNVCGAGESAKARERDEAINKEIVESEQLVKKERKLLILGESGKSTIMKQLKLIYGTGFSDSEKADFRSQIVSNVTECVAALVRAMDTLEIPYGFSPSDYASSELLAICDTSNVCEHVPDRVVESCNSVHIQSIVELNISPLAQMSRKIYSERGCGLENIPGAAELIKDFKSNKYKKNELLPVSQIEAIKIFWNDPGVKYCLSRSNEFQLLEAAT
ncbi:hypothetical protein HDU83_005484 [Entophlyctis luteolus]|nr:hypothetical protein HDU83_005484 [Entophlyctis luteolus]